LQIIYHDDYKNKIKGKWSQTPCYDVVIAKMNAENLSMVSKFFRKSWNEQLYCLYMPVWQILIKFSYFPCCISLFLFKFLRGCLIYNATAFDMFISTFPCS